MLTILEYDSPIGPLTLTQNETAIVSVRFGAIDDVYLHTLKQLTGDGDYHTVHQGEADSLSLPVVMLSNQLEVYFSGCDIDFNVPYQLLGTPFQVSVWEQIAKIPYGHLISYGTIAAAIGNPKSSQAVGQATGRNPMPILIPCHRVLGSKGQLTGFSAPNGLETKRQLLRIERLML